MVDVRDGMQNFSLTYLINKQQNSIYTAQFVNLASSE